MPRLSPRILLLITFILIASLIYLAGVNSVPFHPDESTQLFMSSDFQTFFQQPSSVFWQPQPADELRQHYRLLDPPLTRTWIGFVRWLTRQPDLPSDWDWSQSWQANQSAGALPDPNLLQTGRLAVAFFFPFTLTFMYLAGRELGGAAAGWISMVLTISSALVLLHTRRAMAEGLLFAGVAFSLWTLVAWRKRPWLIAIPIALAFNAKYSAAPMVLVAVIAILWNTDEYSRPWREKFLQLAAFVGIFAGLTLLLNPFLWAHPFQALSSAITARTDFMRAQSVDFAAAGIFVAPQTVFQSLAAMMAQLFFSPPTFAEVSNYLAQTQGSVEAYLSNPLNNFLRGLVGGGIQLGFFLLGMVTIIRGIFNSPKLQQKRHLVLFLSALLIEIIFLLITVNVTFQRYFMVLFPMVILTMGLGLSSLIQFVGSIYQTYRRGRK